MNKTPQIRISGFGCLLLIIVAIGLPCLAIWYFGMLSLILSGMGCVCFWVAAFLTDSAYTKREKRQARVAFALGLLFFGLVIYINYFAK
jgi:fatty acid desaturase